MTTMFVKTTLRRTLPRRLQLVAARAVRLPAANTAAPQRREPREREYVLLSASRARTKARSPRRPHQHRERSITPSSLCQPAATGSHKGRGGSRESASTPYSLRRERSTSALLSATAPPARSSSLGADPRRLPEAAHSARISLPSHPFQWPVAVRRLLLLAMRPADPSPRRQRRGNYPK